MNKIVNGVANDYEFNDIGYYQEINIPARQNGKKYQVINIYEQKYKKLQSNWNSLREFVYSLWLDDKGIVLKIRDNMNKLEGKDNDE